MTQFTVKEYLKNPSRKVVTKDGRKVRIICIDCHQAYYPVVGLVSDYGAEEESVVSFTENGQYCLHDPKTDILYDSELDLFFAPEKHEGWVNVYCGASTVLGKVFRTKEEALAKSCPGRTDTVKIEWEE